MTTKPNELDTLLELRELNPPFGFKENLMTTIEQDSFAHDKHYFSLSDFMQLIVFTVGGIYGVFQSLYFLFGIWFFTAAG